MSELDRRIAALEDVDVQRHPDRLELRFPEGLVLVRWDERPAFARVGGFGVSHRGEATAPLLGRLSDVSDALRGLEAPPCPARPSPASELASTAPIRAVHAAELARALDAIAGLAPGSFRRRRGAGQAGSGNKLVFVARAHVAQVFPTASWAPRLARRQRALEAAGALVPPLYAHGELPGPLGYLLYGRVREGLRDGAARRLGTARFAGALGGSLARFHAASEGGAAPADAHIQAALELTRWPDLERRAMAVRLHEALVETATDAPPHTSLIHADVHPGNALLVGPRALLLDLDAARTGDPALDLAAARATCARSERAWRALRGGYERHGGRALDPRRVDRLVVLLALSALRGEARATPRRRWVGALREALARLGWASPR